MTEFDAAGAPRSGSAGHLRQAATGTVAIANHLAADAARAALRDDVRHGLQQHPKSLPPKWFYDETGSELFDRITRLPEYYPTRAEAQILRRHSAEVAAVSAADTLVELGSGTSEKTRMLLDALRDCGSLRRFVPFDVDAGVLQTAGEAIARDYPGIAVQGVCGDFEHHLAQIPAGGRRLFVFLGSTIGNLTSAPRAAFLAGLAAVMHAGDGLLLGTDLVKDTARLVRAYDDAAGATAAFNRNVLAVVNRELDADFELDAFDHVARWNSAEQRMEMWLRSRRAQRVVIGALDLAVDFAAGEEMLTEVSCKFRREQVAGELAAAGLRPRHWWTDTAGDFGLSLALR
ncbi:L-histidine N(alpha)-methyltransferase [Mycolicibacter minnesotensis]